MSYIGQREITENGLVMPNGLGDEFDDKTNWPALDQMLSGTHPTVKLPRIVSGQLVNPNTGLPLSVGGYAGPSATGNDDSLLLQEFFDDMSSDALASKRQIKVIFGLGQTYLTQGNFLRSNLEIDLNGSHIKKISTTMGNNEFTSSQVAVFRTGPWAKNGNTWYGNADNITVRNGTLDTNNCDNRGVIELHGVRNFWADGLTLITSQWAQAWAIRGGGYAFFTNGRILGQARLYQDGLHWQYGGAMFNNWYVQAGDDAMAAGDDAGNANVYMDDQGLEFFMARNIHCVSTRGAAIKVYTPASKPFASAPNNYTKTGRVRGVDVQVTGRVGQLRNGGVSVFSHAAAGSRNPDDLQGIRIHADLTVGTDGRAVWDAVSGTIVGSPTSVTQQDAVNSSTGAVVTLNNHGLSAGQVVTFLLPPGSMNTLNGFYKVRPLDLTTNSFRPSDYAYRDSWGLSTGSAAPWTSGQLIAVGSGSGYAVGDELTLSGGTYVRQAKWLVTQVSATGAVEAIRRLDEGDYSVLPDSPNSPTGGSGTGCTLHLHTAHDGVNAYGVKCVAGSDVTITGRININDTANTATRFRSFWIEDSCRTKLYADFPAVPAQGGLLANGGALQLSRNNEINCRMFCPDNLTLDTGMSPIMLSNSADTVVSGLIENLPAGATAVAFPVGGNSIGSRNIVGITGASNSAFQCAHGGWKAGQIVKISGNVLSSGSLDGYYIIRNVPDTSSLQLKTLQSGTPPNITPGTQVGLGAATVTTLGTIELANNTAVLRDLTVTVKPNTNSHVGVNAANNAPHRMSMVTIENCDFSAAATPIGTNVTQAPVRYAVNNTKV